MCLFVRVLSVAVAAACLAACTAVVDSTTEARYGQYNYTTDWAKNEAILLNVVRASFYQPLNFLAYQAYGGTATATATASSPGFIVGPQRSASQKQYTFSNSTVNATGTGTAVISVQNLDTQDFYDALLSPVDFTNLYAFQRQGYPREVLFRLFTDYVSLKPPVEQDPQGRRAIIVYNDVSPDKSCVDATALKRQIYPSSLWSRVPDQICFGDLVEFALLSGLSSEIRNVAAPASSSSKPSASDTSAKTTTPSSSTPATGTSKPNTQARLCFDGALANNATAEFRRYPPQTWISEGRDIDRFLRGVRLADYHPVCGLTTGLDAWPSQGSDFKKGAAGPSSNQSAGTNTLYVSVTVLTGQLIWDLHQKQHNTVEIGTRSTFGIYNFLGQVMNNQDSDINMMRSPPELVNDVHLLTVHKGQPAVGCFVWTVLDLGVYCVPVDGAHNTKRSFSILSQLLALKTSQGDLQLQPIFRLLSQ